MRTLALLLLCAVSAVGTTYTSTKSGSWSDRTVWNADPGVGSYPCQTAGNYDIVVIATGHDVLLDAGVVALCGRANAAVGHAVEIKATNSTVYGRLRVTDWLVSGAKLTLAGYDSTTNTLMLINQYAKFEPQPGAVIVGDPGVDGRYLLNNGIITATGTCTGWDPAHGTTCVSGWNPVTFTGVDANHSWATQITNEVNGPATVYKYDNVRSMLLLKKTYISNAAGTGPAVCRDTSVVFNAVTGPTINTEVCSVDQVNAVGKWYCNYEVGACVYWWAGGVPTFDTSYKYLTISKGWVISSLQNTDYNAAVFANCLFTYMGSSVADDHAAVAWTNRTSAAKNPLRVAGVTGSTFQYNGRSISLRKSAGVVGGLIQITGNQFHPNIADMPSGFTGIIQSRATTASYFNISQNYLVSRYGFYVHVATYGVLTMESNPGVKFNNNWGWTGAFFQSGQAEWPDLEISGNVTDGPGRGDSQSGATVGARWVLGPRGTAGHPAVIQNNYVAHQARFGHWASYSNYYNNTVLWTYHHGLTGSSVDNRYTTDVNVKWNVFSGIGPGYDTTAIETAYSTGNHSDNIVLEHNTIAQSLAGVGFGDIVDTGVSSLNTNVVSRNNLILSTTYGTRWNPPASNRIAQVGILQDGPNWYYGPGTTFYNYYQGGTFKQGATLYNTSGTRNITGVALWNPSYTGTSNSHTLTLAVTSDLDQTLQWDAGTPQQLAWGASPAVYTVASSTTCGTGAATPKGECGTVTVSDTTGWSVTPGNAASPSFMWVKVLTGTLAGTVRAIVLNTSTVLTVVPDWPGAVGPVVTDTIGIYKTQVTLPDAATGTVMAGIDYRVLPTSTPSADANIDITETDVIGTNPALLNGGWYNNTRRGSYAPTNATLATAATDGTAPGALAVVPTGSGLAGRNNNPVIIQ